MEDQHIKLYEIAIGVLITIFCLTFNAVQIFQYNQFETRISNVILRNSDHSEMVKIKDREFLCSVDHLITTNLWSDQLTCLSECTGSVRKRLIQARLISHQDLIHQLFWDMHSTCHNFDVLIWWNVCATYKQIDLDFTELNESELDSTESYQLAVEKFEQQLAQMHIQSEHYKVELIMSEDKTNQILKILIYPLQCNCTH